MFSSPQDRRRRMRDKWRYCPGDVQDLLQACQRSAPGVHCSNTRSSWSTCVSRDEVDACLHLLTIRLLMDGMGLALVLLESSEDTSKCE
jgi:hypothetical protein